MAKNDTKKQAHPDSICPYCGRLVSSGKRGRRRYCSLAHKQAAYRRRLRSGAKRTNEY